MQSCEGAAILGQHQPEHTPWRVEINSYAAHGRKPDSPRARQALPGHHMLTYKHQPDCVENWLQGGAQAPTCDAQEDRPTTESCH